MSKKYVIRITEMLRKTVIADAEDINEAMEKVQKAYEEGKIVLTDRDYDENDIEPSPYFDGEITDESLVSECFYLDE